MSSTTLPLLDRQALASLPRLFVIGDAEPVRNRRGKRALRALSLLFLLGLGAAGVAAARGHHVMGTTSEVSWGILIATYVFFAVSSTGLCLVGSLGSVFGFKLFAPIDRRAILLAWILLVLGFGVLASELERPLLLAKLVFLSPNPRSPIWWMGTLYGVYFTLLSLELFFLLRHQQKRARRAAIPKLLFAVAASSNLGAVFASSHARPYWWGPFVPVYLIVTALVCGAALLALLVWFGDVLGDGGALRPSSGPLLEGLGKLLALFLGVQLLFTAWRTIAGLAGDHQGLAQVVQAMVSGPLFFSFWFFEVLLGLAAPLLILLSPRRREPKLVALAASLPVMAMLVVRYNFVYAGQMLSLKPLVGRGGEMITYAPPFKGNLAGFLPYTPSLVEALIVAGALSGAVLLYVVLARALGFEREES